MKFLKRILLISFVIISSTVEFRLRDKEPQYYPVEIIKDLKKDNFAFQPIPGVQNALEVPISSKSQNLQTFEKVMGNIANPQPVQNAQQNVNVIPASPIQNSPMTKNEFLYTPYGAIHPSYSGNEKNGIPNSENQYYKVRTIEETLRNNIVRSLNAKTVSAWLDLLLTKDINRMSTVEIRDTLADFASISQKLDALIQKKKQIINFKNTMIDLKKKEQKILQDELDRINGVNKEVAIEITSKDKKEEKSNEPSEKTEESSQESSQSETEENKKKETPKDKNKKIQELNDEALANLNYDPDIELVGYEKGVEILSNRLQRALQYLNEPELATKILSENIVYPEIKNKMNNNFNTESKPKELSETEAKQIIAEESKKSANKISMKLLSIEKAKSNKKLNIQNEDKTLYNDIQKEATKIIKKSVSSLKDQKTIRKQVVSEIVKDLINDLIKDVSEIKNYVIQEEVEKEIPNIIMKIKKKMDGISRRRRR